MEHCTLYALEVDSIRLAVLTTSPSRTYLLTP